MNEIKSYYVRERTEVAFHIPLNIKSILDIGCGQGAFLKLIKEKTKAETWGIEMVAAIGEKAKEHADKIFIGKAEDVLSSIPDYHFDCITFNDVLEHLLEPTEVLKMVRTKLSEKGLIVTSIPNVRYIRNLHELIINKDWEYKNEGILDSTHFRFFTQKSMRRMFENAGYKIIKQIGINKINTRKFRLFNFISCGFFSDTKYLQFICIASKI